MKPDVEKALALAIAALYFDDSHDYGTALWEIVQALGGDEASNLLQNDEQAAYEKYAKGR